MKDHVVLNDHYRLDLYQIDDRIVCTVVATHKPVEYNIFYHDITHSTLGEGEISVLHDICEKYNLDAIETKRVISQCNYLLLMNYKNPTNTETKRVFHLHPETTVTFELEHADIVVSVNHLGQHVNLFRHPISPTITWLRVCNETVMDQWLNRAGVQEDAADDFRRAFDRCIMEFTNIYFENLNQ